MKMKPTFFLFFVLASVASLKNPSPVLADEVGHSKSNQCVRALFSDSWKRLIDSVYSKIIERVPQPNVVRTSAVTQKQIIQADLEVRKTLSALGVVVDETKLPPYLSELVATQENPEGRIRFDQTPGVREAFFGTILRVLRLPKPALKSDPNALALTHPDMPSALQDLKKLGYDFYIDTSLRFADASSYFDGEFGMIGIQPNTPWHVFIHELQHAKWNRFLESVISFDALQSKIESGKTLKELLSLQDRELLDPEILQKLESLLKQGVPENGIDETLAVGVQLKALDLPSYNHTYQRFFRYARRHQVWDLKAAGPLSETQKGSLRRAAVEELLGSEASVSGVLTSKNPYLIGILAATVVILTDERARRIFLKLLDGTWVVLPMKSS